MMECMTAWKINYTIKGRYMIIENIDDLVDILQEMSHKEIYHIEKVKIPKDVYSKIPEIEGI